MGMGNEQVAGWVFLIIRSNPPQRFRDYLYLHAQCVFITSGMFLKLPACSSKSYQRTFSMDILAWTFNLIRWLQDTHFVMALAVTELIVFVEAHTVLCLGSLMYIVVVTGQSF